VLQPDPSARYALCASIEHRAEAGIVRITSAGGDVQVEDDDHELLGRIVETLRACGGTAALAEILDRQGLPFQVIEPLLADLLGIAALHDVRHAWTYFHHLSANPFTVPPPLSEQEAYALDRWRPPAGQATTSVKPVATMAYARRSADLEAHLEAREPLDPKESMEQAIALAADTYRLEADEHRPLASGGAMWPLQFWAVGGPGDELDVVAIDHDHDRLTKVRTVTRDGWRGMFLPDPAVHEVIRRGAATVVITVDPRRTTGKYGNRGWRYALMEVGAAAHHIGLLAAERRVAARPIGGFYDLPMSKALDGGLPALLTVLVMA